MNQEFSKNHPEAANMVTIGNEVFNRNLLPILTRNDGNLVYSPMSAHTLLSLAYYSAVDETAQKLQNALNVSDAKSVALGYKFWMESLNCMRKEKVNIANKIFVDEKWQLTEEFRSASREYFLSEAENINFKESKEAAAKINNWVKNKTQGFIEDVVNSGELGDDSCFCMVNAIYFKGDWLHKFTKSDFSKFFISEKNTVDCTMMLEDKHLPYGEDDDLDAQILKMPYASKKTSFLVILPRSKTGINRLCDKLQTKKFSDLNDILYPVDVKISLPKFRINTTMELNAPLKELGLGIIFNDGAQFPNMLECSKPIIVSKILQKAYINVNEIGTEAAVASFITKKYASWKPDLKKAVFNADHPFVFCVCYHHEQALLPIFVGVLKCPTKEEKWSSNAAEALMQEMNKRAELYKDFCQPLNPCDE